MIRVQYIFLFNTKPVVGEGIIGSAQILKEAMVYMILLICS
jgi:hypothetical protein